MPSLESLIEQGIAEAEAEVLADADRWQPHEKVHFLVEKANICILLGWESKAKDALASATELSQFMFACPAPWGSVQDFKRRAQASSLCSRRVRRRTGQGRRLRDSFCPSPPPERRHALEEVHYSKDATSGGAEVVPLSDFRCPPSSTPDEQPQLSPLDQIILLTEASLKDVFSPADSLTSEEILPYAVRVVSDKSTNWQIYTQALLVRSRIEVHRSRTAERGILQMQALSIRSSSRLLHTHRRRKRREQTNHHVSHSHRH